MKTLLFFFLLLCTIKINSDEKKELSYCLADMLWITLNEYHDLYDLDTLKERLDHLHQGSQKPKEPRECYTQLAKLLEKPLEEEATANLKKANDFIKKIKKDPEVQEVLKDKIYYKTIKKGSKNKINHKTSIYLHFIEKNLSGKIIKNTHESNMPIKVTLSETIPGFKLGLIGMKIGEKRILYIHPSHAFQKVGKRAPNQLAIFEVEALHRRDLLP